MADLIRTEDAEAYLGVTFDDDETQRAATIIGGLSGRIQRYCNRVGLTRVVDDVITMRGTYSSTLILPRPPVVAVASVTIDDVAVSDWELIGADRLVRVRGPLNGEPLLPREPFGSWGGDACTVEVTYTHGLAEVPDEVVEVALQLFARRWYNPAGVRSTSIDGYSVTNENSEGELFESLKSWRRTAYSARV